MKKYTIFCDIDGTLFVYRAFNTYLTTIPEPIVSVIDKINKMVQEGHCIILTSARPENLREHTIKELQHHHIQYHQLVLGLERGTRYLINDKEDDAIDRAIGINISRNKGFTDNDIDMLNFP